MTLLTKDLTGRGRCKNYRKHALSLVTDDASNNADIAAFARNEAREGITCGPDAAGLDARADAFFDTLSFDAIGTKRILREEAKRCVSRYLSSETRRGQAVPERTVDLFGEGVKTCPDALFKGMREFERTVEKGKKKEKKTSTEPYVEAVVFKYRKPDVSIRGRNPDAGVMTNLELYALLLYVKRLVHESLEDGTRINVGASFYFLKKSTDAPDKFSPGFFLTEKGERPNTVTLWDSIEAGNGAPTSVDLAYVGVYERFKNGEDLSGSDACRWCPRAPLCTWKPAEMPLGAAKSVAKDVRNITLTESQEKAIAFRSGVARINAGAGSGKTLVVAMRTARLLLDSVSPERILLITFTNAGADEFTERIGDYAGAYGYAGDAGKVRTATFNSFGDSLVKEYYGEFGFSHEPELIDDVERAQIVADLIGTTDIGGLDYRNFDCTLPTCRGALPVALHAFDVFRASRLTKLSDAGASKLLKALGRDEPFAGDWHTVMELFKLYSEKYVPLLRRRCLMEYDDQVLLALELLRKHPELPGKLGYEHIIVDEFQDTDGTQLEILKALMGHRGFRSLMAVGDDSQAIYGFRGSDPGIIVDFAKRLGMPCEDFYLLENHRSTPEIIGFANRVNAKNRKRVKKDLVATRPGGAPVKVVGTDSTPDLNGAVVSVIRERHDGGVPYGDIAYIAYTRSELIRAKKLLDEAGIPASLMCPEPLTENPRVLGAIAFAKLVQQPDSAGNAFGYLAALCGDRLDTMDDRDIENLISRVQEGAKLVRGRDALLGALQKISEASGGADEAFEAFLDSVRRKRDHAEILRYCESFAKYGESEAFRRRGNYPGVTLITAHSSKGMEWPVVINNVTKYDSPELHGEELAERRRLMFVSATRARDDLTVIGKELTSGKAGSGKETYNRLLDDARDAVS